MAKSFENNNPVKETLSDTKRASGILLPISALPSEFGIGTLGESARSFIDFLANAGQYWWQILPVNPTAYGDSPYQSPSAFAGNPYFVDPQLLYEDGLLTKDEMLGAKRRWSRIDYGELYLNRGKLIRTAASRLGDSEMRQAFEAENAFWLDSYALFTALRSGAGVPLSECMSMTPQERELTARSLQSLIREIRGVQYLFFSQWFNMRKYANTKGVHIIGDVPIYVACDSADVWSHPKLFILTDDGAPLLVAGCPPDDFSADGQRWGNPMYDWRAHKAQGYEWWLSRLKQAETLFDRVRIDHFRGFYSGYAIPGSAVTAREGEWLPGPGMDFVNTVRASLPGLDVIAEDLGFVTPEVRQFFSSSGFPGMEIMLFAFDGDALPYTFGKSKVVYTGTHDNATAVEWLCGAKNETLCRAMDYLGVSRITELPKALICAAMASQCDTCIIPMCDWLAMGAEGRINRPSVAENNWVFRLDSESLTEALSKRIRSATALYNRLQR